ncbi:hypothetical protein CLAFUW4_09704 [Fulvia fulva]|uniref:Uncharacterized protein n=1 Tax=Passalora fulva TaxID=5499 RepID=A0A9Q8PGE2_PASFU|nr:uncharacterized protein CLAFUR5_09797 [Fulvia fulva]KAK4613599.1 hypothetical protein CLAFUR4_09709 [Fulvia fulva]KAK4615277.1 hypothetical protein CLAFUR0_09700 [Fulvia fulva]UJO22020.1 hypothetical protein CLAFUR5_09797 [Fulvia fulva]WPV19783.1 hypothetical protein CLAFUW4_09704 [Fulvia fulva]WPV34780.1 hypothetical protein CLAFUW7_09705 [Fulvia fulva]
MDGMPEAASLALAVWRDANIEVEEPTASPVWRVLNTPELLEMILLELGHLSGHALQVEKDVKADQDAGRWHAPSGLRTLLYCQRVSRTFRDAIQSSFWVQQKLWFTPTAGSAADASIGHRRNPMIHDLGPARMDALGIKFFTHQTRTYQDDNGVSYTRPWVAISFDGAALRKQAESHDQAIWRKMLVVRPYEPEMRWTVWLDDLHIHSGRLHLEPPLAFEKLIDFALEEESRAAAVRTALEARIKKGRPWAE